MGSKGARSLEKRWTPALAQTGHTSIVTPFLDLYAAMALNTSEAMFIIHLLQHKWDERNPYPTYRTIADKMGVSRDHASRICKGLEQDGFITRIQRRQARDKSEANEFDLSPLFGLLERLHGAQPNEEKEVILSKIRATRAKNKKLPARIKQERPKDGNH